RIGSRDPAYVAGIKIDARVGGFAEIAAGMDLEVPDEPAGAIVSHVAQLEATALLQPWLNKAGIHRVGLIDEAVGYAGADELRWTLKSNAGVAGLAGRP